MPQPLAHALVLHGDADLGEAIYCTAIRLFPDNPVCCNDLAHTLRITDHRDQAVAVYREAQQQFPRNPVALNGACGYPDRSGTVRRSGGDRSWTKPTSSTSIRKTPPSGTRSAAVCKGR